MLTTDDNIRMFLNALYKHYTGSKSSVLAGGHAETNLLC